LNVSNNVVFSFSVQVFQSAGSLWSGVLFRGGLFTRHRFPDLETGTSNHRTMSACDSGVTSYTIRLLQNIVKKHREFIPSVEKSNKEVEGYTDYKAVNIALFFTISALMFFFWKAVVSMGSSKEGSITMVSASCPASAARWYFSLQ
jgi:hypothetical protein